MSERGEVFENSGDEVVIHLRSLFTVVAYP